MAWDRYAGMNNNPVIYSDPSGHEVCSEPDENGDIRCFTDQHSWEERHFKRGFIYAITLPLRIKNPNYKNFGENRDKNKDDVFYPKADRYHMSVDCGSANVGDEIHPVFEGTVAAAGWSKDFGNYIIVKHEYQGETYYSVYAHLGTSIENSGILTSVGAKVSPSDIIGTSGNTKGGGGTSNHLHFEVRTAVNINLSQPDPFGNLHFWGYFQSEWRLFFLDLGKIIGYHSDYSGMYDKPPDKP